MVFDKKKRRGDNCMVLLKIVIVRKIEENITEDFLYARLAI